MFTRIRTAIRHHRIRLARPLRRLDAYDGVVVDLRDPAVPKERAPLSFA